MEVGDDEVGLGEVHVHPERAEEDAGASADDEQADKAEGVDHGSGEGNGAAIEGGGPVEDLDGRGNGYQHG